MSTKRYEIYIDGNLISTDYTEDDFGSSVEVITEYCSWSQLSFRFTNLTKG